LTACFTGTRYGYLVPVAYDILREACESFLFMRKGRVVPFAEYDALVTDPDLRGYLGAPAPG